MTKEPNCYNCKHLVDVFGNYVECGLYYKETTGHIFVDYWYWNSSEGSPDECPLKKREVAK